MRLCITEEIGGRPAFDSHKSNLVAEEALCSKHFHAYNVCLLAEASGLLLTTKKQPCSLRCYTCFLWCPRWCPRLGCGVSPAFDSHKNNLVAEEPLCSKRLHACNVCLLAEASGLLLTAKNTTLFAEVYTCLLWCSKLCPCLGGVRPAFDRHNSNLVAEVSHLLTLVFDAP